MYDVIIVGARCAGSPLAMLLAKQGADVLLVDRATFPRDIPQGHFIHRHGPRRLRNWGLLDKVAARTPAVTGCLGIRHIPHLARWCSVGGRPVGGEFRKFPEFLSFFQSDTILCMHDIFTLFLHAIVIVTGLVDPMGSVLLLPNPS